jgi:hypothetical protein
MLKFKGKLKRLNAGMSSFEFWELVDKRRNERGWHGANSRSSVRAAVASIYRVKPEYEAEVAATVQMLCDGVTIMPSDLIMVMDVFALKPLRFYVFERRPLALETDKGWLVYPLNFRHLNWQLSRREKYFD